jgi:hypothetical protein
MMRGMIKILIVMIISLSFFAFTVPLAVTAASPTTTVCPDGLKVDPSNPKSCIPEDGCQNNNQFKSFITGNCLSTYEDWLGEVWGWSLRIMIPLSVLILSGAGVLYMVSEGDSSRIALAKKLIIGVFSGVGLLIVARVILNVIGVGNSWNL